jgi:ribosomal protein S8
MSKEFDQLVIDTDKGVITKEEALARSYSLRTKPNLPSEVTHENIDETFNFLNNENYLADIYQEQIKKDELVKQTQQQNVALQQEIERRDKIESDKKQKLIEEEFDNNKKTYINTEWEKVKSSQNRDLLFSSIVFLLNLALSISAVILTSTTKLKNWISEFDFWQISVIVIYSLIIVVEIFGSKYIFNKEKLKNGWFWFTLIFDNDKKFEFEETTKKHLDEVYNEKHSDPRKPSS